ncbi:RNA polymerase I-specific transcription initiation factor RRN6-like protein [Talaromyces proteolyticus]|uniref:RNA polymerase I-specific transcription initiation factor RRN6-like protein n=1 Tax=Talaromyces proteolyticus TaxID=1131652 RepID=A0AAD4KK49_9EURO|nr:RNA polymerase I-specific transcription initiation factor RRN6-like protein [Talaromyces proteolyticus]KAH8693086.1 RNA polymerase I-specific transcription initiation factor RRN6-like protein [Talaromyces proteolyticus]
MDDKRADADALRYGHPGPATYSASSQSWNFSRDFSRRYILSHTGLQKLAVPPQSSVSGLERDRNEEQALFKGYPELLGVTLSFERMEEISRMIHEATSFFDPKISSLIDFGNAVPSNFDRSEKPPPIPIAAFATGRNGNILSFWSIDNQSISTNQKPEIFIRVPTIGGSYMSNSPCGESPIRQIRFAESLEEPASLLAVRLESCTLILQPRYHKSLLPVQPLGTSSHKRFPLQSQSRISPNLLVEITTSQTGGFPHVDVAFNPWFPSQVGVIDERGNWNLWDLSNLLEIENGGSTTIEHLQSGSLPWSDLNGHLDADVSVQYDGWGKIEWVGNVNTFFACNRRDAVLYITEDTTAMSCTVEFNWGSPSEWILDVKVPSHAPEIFILTTLRVLCLDISYLIQHPQSSVSPRLSWRHNRDPDDLTLRLTSISVGEEYYLVLYSRLDACILAFQVSFPRVDDSMTTCFAEPFYVYIPPTSIDQGLATIRHTAFLKTILFKEVEQEALTDQDDFAPHARLIKLFVLDDTLSIREHLFSLPLTQGTSSATDFITSRDALPLMKRTAYLQKKELFELDLLGIGESDIGELASQYSFTHNLSESVSLAKPFSSRAAVDFTLLYATLAGHRSPSPKDSTDTSFIRVYRSLKQCLERLAASFLDTTEIEPVTGQTMLEIINSLPVSSDIDESSQDIFWYISQFAQISKTTGSLMYYLPLGMSIQHVDKLAKSVVSYQRFNMLEFYDKLTQYWLSTLPEDLPAWTRVSKEKAIRNITTELSLATMTYIGTPLFTSPGAVVVPSTPQETDLMPSSSHTSELDHSQVGVRETYDMLGLGSLVGKVTDDTLPTAAEDILSDWVIGGDPHAVNWRKIISYDASTNKTTMPERVRRLSRSRSRGLTEDLKLIRSSPIVPIVQDSGSQSYQTIPRDKLFSSQVVEENLPMTQVERGLFGGRQGARSRKKKRTAGF